MNSKIKPPTAFTDVHHNTYFSGSSLAKSPRKTTQEKILIDYPSADTKKSDLLGGTGMKESGFLLDGETTVEQMLLSDDSILDTFYSQRVEKSSTSPKQNVQQPSCFYTQSKD